MAKQADDRYATASEFATAVTAALAGYVKPSEAARRPADAAPGTDTVASPPTPGADTKPSPPDDATA